MILDGLANMLKLAGSNYELIATAIEEAGGLDKMERLQSHTNEDIYKLAYTIVDKYFNSDVSGCSCTGNILAYKDVSTTFSCNSIRKMCLRPVNQRPSTGALQPF